MKEQKNVTTCFVAKNMYTTTMRFEPSILGFRGVVITTGPNHHLLFSGLKYE